MSEPIPLTQPLETERLSSGASTDVLERPDVREQVESGDAERYAHYVKKEKIMASAVSGAPVIALCGKVWTPGRDPNKYPICPACKAIFDGLNAGGGDDAGSGQGKGFFGFGSKK